MIEDIDKKQGNSNNLVEPKSINRSLSSKDNPIKENINPNPVSNNTPKLNENFGTENKNYKVI